MIAGRRLVQGIGTAACLASLVLAGQAQEAGRGEQGGQARGGPDPRVGLKPGLRDAGQAIRNLQLVASIGRPAGFVDPAAPLGAPTPPERERRSSGSASAARKGGAEPRKAPQNGEEEPKFDAARMNQLSFWNSDLAFAGRHMFVGNFHGFNIYDVEAPRTPELVASIVCPGGQGDVSVHGHLLIMSVEQVRGRIDCGTQGVPTPVNAERFRGVRIFDITDLKKPRQVAAVQTCRGSHTHTLVTDPKDPANLYIYGSGTSVVRSGDELAGCSGADPKEDPNTALFSIDVIQVPLAAPQQAKIVNRPRIFADPATGELAGLWKGGHHGEKTQTTSVTNQCHDITVFPSAGLAAGACSGNGILLDISDPIHPVRLDAVLDKNFAYWHSATFNNDGTKVVFTDEWGGGTRPRCRATDLPNWGANAIFDIVDRTLQFRGYYKMPAAQTETENCVAHNGSIIPVPGRDIMVQAWYQGGLSVFDFTDSEHPQEIAFFDRGPIDAKKLYTGGYWSAYWYNGAIYATEIIRGLDVFRLRPSEFLSQNEIAAAVLVQTPTFNAQQQPRVTWPATTEVAGAYLDQLGRANGITSARAAAIRAALSRADAAGSSKDPAAAQQLETTAGELAGEAAGASGRTANTITLLADLLKNRAARLR
ncbi:MAG: LVIVD repeat-containing protein [Vicinamibacterales bacterium]